MQYTTIVCKDVISFLEDKQEREKPDCHIAINQQNVLDIFSTSDSNDDWEWDEEDDGKQIHLDLLNLIPPEHIRSLHLSNMRNEGDGYGQGWW